MHINVIYALPNEQFIEEVDAPDGTTAGEAVRMSGLLEKCPEIDLSVNKLGIFAKLVKNDYILQEGDRVEVYRALPKKPRDAHAADDKKARIRAKKERRLEEKTE
jgi:putative ubiquitin-RnfH superfamily antitoxin RatB of RatAB toxin-antitoxin module